YFYNQVIGAEIIIPFVLDRPIDAFAFGYDVVEVVRSTWLEKRLGCSGLDRLTQFAAVQFKRYGINPINNVWRSRVGDRRFPILNGCIGSDLRIEKPDVFQSIT